MGRALEWLLPPGDLISFLVIFISPPIKIYEFRIFTVTLCSLTIGVFCGL